MNAFAIYVLQSTQTANAVIPELMNFQWKIEKFCDLENTFSKLEMNMYRRMGEFIELWNFDRFCRIECVRALRKNVIHVWLYADLRC